ncbi:hypothetical protein MLD38_035180 [Melastoma candidum]|uniref:Uncharacterized protein n=1 Tax=Melastoma candidum TaxID=119954 RepID=A0ACB9MCB6_9MYRT|nr:hypothetical protein MLD38_035180 [Melastoma candidum]
MSLRHFVKHLSAAASRRLIPPTTSPSPSSLSFVHSAFERGTCYAAPSSRLRKRSFSSSARGEPSTPPADLSGYLSVQIRCPRHAADLLSEALLSFGATSASIDLGDGCHNHPEICITSIYPPDEDVAESISKASDSVGLKELPQYQVEVLDLEQEGWIRKTQESFAPVEVCDGLWIVPEWRTPPDARATNIILNPGLAFGTGEHPTTKLCLKLLHGLIMGGEHVLDYGTGSGILAIAALKLGAAHATGVDIDPQAISSAQYNASLNNIGPEKLQLCLITSENSSSPGETESGNYDVVVANILLNPLLELADHIVSQAKPGATVGLSGILWEQVADIRSRYSGLLEELLIAEMDGWACISGKRKSESKF